MKCPYCGKDKLKITKKGGIPPHVTPGNQRCIGAGMVLGPSFSKR